MNLNQYDKVLLYSGEYAYIVEMFDDGRVLLADIDKETGTETDWIKSEDIKEIVQ